MKNASPRNNSAKVNIDIVLKYFAQEAKKLNAHPSEEAVKRAITRLLNDLSKVRPSSPAKKRISILIRLGRMLKSASYRTMLGSAIIGGGILSGVGFFESIWALGKGDEQARALAAGIVSLLGTATWYKGVTKSIAQFRNNIAPSRRNRN